MAATVNEEKHCQTSKHYLFLLRALKVMRCHVKRLNSFGILRTMAFRLMVTSAFENCDVRALLSKAAQLRGGERYMLWIRSYNCAADAQRVSSTGTPKLLSRWQNGPSSPGGSKPSPFIICSK